LKENVVTKLPNYYGVLGVPSTASQDEIRKAYRQLARQHHPDVNPLDKDDAAANEFMRQLNEAYAVLGDASRRAAYDRQRWAQFRPPRQSSTRRSRPTWSWADERQQPSRASSRHWWDLATSSVTTNWPRPSWLPKFPAIPEFLKVRLQLLAISLLGPLLVLAGLIVVTSANSASGEVFCTAAIVFPLFLGAWAALWRWSIR
jgi:hypothetical protein